MEETILVGDDLMMGPPSPLIPSEIASHVLEGVDLCDGILRNLFLCKSLFFFSLSVDFTLIKFSFQIVLCLLVLGESHSCSGSSHTTVYKIQIGKNQVPFLLGPKKTVSIITRFLKVLCRR